MSGFDRIRRKNGSYFVDDIYLSIVRRVSRHFVGILMGLEFIVHSREARISDSWRKEESQTGHFHFVSLQNRLRFSLSCFILEVLHDYDIIPSQLAPIA